MNILDLPNATIQLLQNYFSDEKSIEYFKYLSNPENVNWKQESMNLYGQELNYPRLIAWYGEAEKNYRFSGKTQNPNDWSKNSIIMGIKAELEAEAGETFNSVLLNKYRNGQDSISWHSDNEKELGENPTIVSLSLGSERTFKMRRFDRSQFLCPFTDKYRKSTNIPLAHNSLLIMKGETQAYWQHAIDKQKDPEFDMFTKIQSLERINLTFRNIKDI